MATYEIKAEGTAYETYEITADSEDEARRLFFNGDAGDVVRIEVEGSDIVSLTRVDEPAVVRPKKAKRGPRE